MSNTTEVSNDLTSNALDTKFFISKVPPSKRIWLIVKTSSESSDNAPNV